VVWFVPVALSVSMSLRRISSVWLGKLTIMSTLSEWNAPATDDTFSNTSSPEPYFV